MKWTSTAAAAAAAVTVLAPSLLVVPVQSTYVHVDGWPHGMPPHSTSLSAVGVDPYVLGGSEVYIAQRGPNLTQPILVFNEAGDLVRSFGGDSIARDASGAWGCHGLSVRATPSDATQIWVNDFVEFTTKVYSAEGQLLATYGTKNVGGPGVSPLQFDKVADTAFGSGASSDVVFVSDGDGSSNHRVVAIDASELPSFSRYSPTESKRRGGSKSLRASSMFTGSNTAGEKIVWVGGNNNTGDAFSDEVDGLSLTSMHSIAHHSRTNTLFAADRENNRTLHVDATSGEVKGVWDIAELLEADHGFETVYGVRTFYSEKYSKDLIILALGDMDSADKPPHQGVMVLDGSHVTPEGPGVMGKPLQEISVDSSKCFTPHLMGVNQLNGNLYVACVGANSAVWKYQFTSATD